MRVQSYIELDSEVRTEAQEAVFQEFCSRFLLSHSLIGTASGREYYHCLLVDAVNLPTMLSLMAARHPVVNGCWDIDGNVYDTEQYPFDLDLHLIHTPHDQSVNGEEVITETEVTEFRPIHGYAGWVLPTEY